MVAFLCERIYNSVVFDATSMPYPCPIYFMRILSDRWR